MEIITYYFITCYDFVNSHRIGDDLTMCL